MAQEADWANPGGLTGATTFGGYGQFNTTARKTGPDDPYDVSSTVRRLVLFYGATLGQGFSVHGELEWEDAIACRTCNGSVEVEQAYIDWQITPGLTLRGGLILVPMGLINEAHEPPVFHGVERPRFAQVIIPTTWRTLGVGAVGRADDVLWKLYLTTGLDPSGLGPAGLQSANNRGSREPAKVPALTGRVDWSPTSTLRLGLAGFFTELGHADDYQDAIGDAAPFVPVIGTSADARWRHAGLEVDWVAAAFFMPRNAQLLKLNLPDGRPLFPAPASSGVPAERIWGTSLVVAYDVLRLLSATRHALLPFVRVEHYDTQATVPDGFSRDPQFSVVETTVGLTYRPISAVAIKLDAQWRDRELGYDEQQINFGLGYAY
jgi:hypothetical protein